MNRVPPKFVDSNPQPSSAVIDVLVRDEPDDEEEDEEDEDQGQEHEDEDDGGEDNGGNDGYSE